MTDRSYIISRPVRGSFTPHHVQGLVIRDYAKRNNLQIGLYLTENEMSWSYMMLRSVLADLQKDDSVVLFTMYSLFSDPVERNHAYLNVLMQGATLHAALEDMAIKSLADIERWENLFLLENVIGSC